MGGGGGLSRGRDGLRGAFTRTGSFALLPAGGGVNGTVGVVGGGDERIS